MTSLAKESNKALQPEILSRTDGNPKMLSPRIAMNIGMLIITEYEDAVTRLMVRALWRWFSLAEFPPWVICSCSERCLISRKMIRQLRTAMRAYGRRIPIKEWMAREMAE